MLAEFHEPYNFLSSISVRRISLTKINRLLQIASLYVDVITSQVLSSIRSKHVSIPEHPNRILIFAYMGLGDAFMFQPAFHALLTRYPSAKVSIVAGKDSPVIEVLRRTASQLNRSLHCVYEANYKSLSIRERGEFNSKIIEGEYDLVVCTYMTPVPYFARAINSIPVRVGHTIPEVWYKPRPNSIFNVPVPLQQDHTHETSRHALLALALGADVPSVRVRLKLNDFERQFADDFWSENSLYKSFVVGTHFGASQIQNWKRWSANGFDATLKRYADKEARILLFGLEEERAGILDSVSSVKEKCIDLIGKLSIFEVAALLSKCDVMLANDSGLGHLSITVGVPTVRLFGMSDYWGYRSLDHPDRDVWIGIECSPCLQLGFLKPYNVHNCGHRNCMKLITPDQVVETLQAIENNI
jgi:heptosyltransferase II